MRQISKLRERSFFINLRQYLDTPVKTIMAGDCSRTYATVTDNAVREEVSDLIMDEIEAEATARVSANAVGAPEVPSRSETEGNADTSATLPKDELLELRPAGLEKDGSQGTPLLPKTSEEGTGLGSARAGGKRVEEKNITSAKEGVAAPVKKKNTTGSKEQDPAPSRKESDTQEVEKMETVDSTRSKRPLEPLQSNGPADEGKDLPQRPLKSLSGKKVRHDPKPWITPEDRRRLLSQ